MSLKVLNKKNGTAEIFLYGDIGENIWGEGISAKQVADEVQRLGGVDTICLNINSPGGIVWDGLAIYNTFKKHKARVVVSIDGLAASIASIVAMSGDEINIAENAFMMIHNPWVYTSGFSEDLRKTAEQLDLVASELRDTYWRRAGGTTSKEAFAALMDAETWFNAGEAIKIGLADTITGEQQMAASFDMSRYQYKNMPNFKAATKPTEDNQARRARLARMDMAVAKLNRASANRQNETIQERFYA